jgi:hypothetical protein
MTVTTNVADRARRALLAAANEFGSGPYNSAGYVADVEDNLVPGVALEDIRDAFQRGRGSELNGKMRAAHSSSALAVNAFGPWSNDPTSLSVAGHSGFSNLAFERQCSSGLGGTPPHLDVVLEGPTSILAIESKCTEYLSPKEPKFAESYFTDIKDKRSSSPWYAEMQRIAQSSDYRFLDAAQLIKHYFGLAKTFSDKPVTLLYLYWEPTNAKQVDAFRQHRDEIAVFGANVRNAEVSFISLSYPELWSAWDSQRSPGWLGAHVAALEARYAVNI